MSSTTLILALTALGATANLTELQVPASGDGAAGDYFGVQLYADSDWLMVGAYGDVINSAEAFSGVQTGTVKIYRLDDNGMPVPTQVLEPPQPTENTLFGDEIRRAGDWLAVSAPRYSSIAGGYEGGGVFLFRLQDDGWQLRHTLLPVGAQDFGRFGEGLLFDGSELWIGASQRGSGGEVWTYRLQGESLVAGPVLASPQPQARFGTVLAALGDGQRIAIGAPAAARVWLYPRVPPLLPVNELNGPPSFGMALAADASVLVVGAPFDGAGSVHRWLLQPDGLAVQPQLTAAAGQPGDQFGATLALAGSTLLVGAVGVDRGPDFDVGAVYRTPVVGGPEVLQSRTLPSDLAVQAEFGTALAVTADGSAVWVGAPLAPVAFQRSGLVRRYDSLLLGVPRAEPQASLDRGAGTQLFRFGQAVAIDGELALAGAFLADTEAGSDSGAAYVYQHGAGGWQLETRLLPADSRPDQRFGIATALSGNTALVGAHWDVVDQRPEQGSAYVYERSPAGDWSQRTKLVASDGRERDQFGTAVALSGEYAAIGAPTADFAGGDSGAVYLFERSSGRWTQQARLLPPVVTPSTLFGYAVALCGEQLLVGAPGLDRGAGLADAGRAWLYRRNGADWSLVQAFESASAQGTAFFGFSVACSGEQFAIGVPGANKGNLLAVGEVELQHCPMGATCTRQTALQRPNPRAGDQFGVAVAVHGRRVLAGAANLDVDGRPDAGGAWLYEGSGTDWFELDALLAPQPGALATFGRAVALDAVHVLIGSPTSAGDNPAEGAVLVGQQPPELFGNGFED